MIKDCLATEIKRGLLTVMPMIIGIVPLGLILGAQASHQGMATVTTVMMTALNFAGGSEFAVIALWEAIPPILVIALTTFLINSRHIIMGATLAPYLKDQSPLRIAFIYFLMCDENWALNLLEIQRKTKENYSQVFSFAFYLTVGLSLYISWSLSAFIRSTLASLIGDLKSYGFELACPATFISLTFGMWPKKQGLKKALPILGAATAAAIVSFSLNQAYAVGLGALTGLIIAFFTAPK